MNDDGTPLLMSLIVVGGTLGGLAAGVCESLFGSELVGLMAGIFWLV